MALHRIDRADLQSLAVEKSCHCQCRNGRRWQDQGQRSKCLGDSDLRLEGPTVRADVKELVGVVLSEGSSHLEHRSNDHIRLEVAKLVQRKRRTP